MQREKAPKAAIIVIISLVVLLLLTLVRPLGYNLLGRIEGDAKFSLFQIWGFVCTMVDLASTAGLIYAAFCDREVRGYVDPYANPYAKNPSAGTPPAFPGPAPLPPLGGPMRPPQ